MKKIIISATLAATLVFGYGCAEKKDSNEAAKEINETKIDDKAVTGAQGASEGDQEDESEYLVDLANTGLTEYELSKVAADRATNPRVKAYAKEAMTEHAAGEKELRDLAQQKNLTLPTTLSDASRSMLAELTEEKAGKDFDSKYLDQMEDINDKAISKAKGVRDNTANTAMKSFVSKIITDDESHKAEAEALEKIL
ncbi:MAG: DUF4142 domain-containing protein [Bacteroidetes bacterium]|nr:DUF4142 domain-containing protein [Fibrella sp.]